MKQPHDINDVLNSIIAAAQSSERQVIHVPDDAPIGTTLRQGDVFYVRVPDDHPHGERQSNQVVTGDTTGSRHTVQEPAECYVGMTQPQVLDRSTGRMVTLTDAFLGACVVAPSRFECPHPEHGHYSLPAGTWQVTQQMDARTHRRMED